MNILKPAAVAMVAIVTVSIMNADTSAVSWKSITEALQEAPKSRKLILLDVYTDWCGWCKRMDRDTYADSSVAAYLDQRFIASKMNPEKEGTVEYDGKSFSQREFGAALGINGYPATAFFNEKNELLTVVPGYIKPEEFLKILKYFGDDHYKTMKWEEYQTKNP